MVPHQRFPSNNSARVHDIKHCAASQKWNEEWLQEVVKLCAAECRKMSETSSQAAEPASSTVGELKAELSRWPDGAPVTFRCPLQDQEFRFYRVQSQSKDNVQVELNQYPETPPVVLA